MKHPLLSRAYFFLLVGIPIIGFLWCFRHSFAIIFSDDNWVRWLTTKETAGSILGSLVGGILTVAAGVFTVIIYNSQSRVENLRQFLEWLSRFNSSFHSDDSYSAVRLKLARERSWIRRQLIMEMLADGDLQPDDLPAEDRDLFGVENLRSREIQWEFLRQFTDYLYFFEQILAFGEILADRGSRNVAPTLVNHFGWFLRSLCICWWEDEWAHADRNKAEAIFAIYLAVNRYRRLAQVTLLLRNSEEARPSPFDGMLFQRISEILEKQTPDIYAARSFEDLEKQWRKIIGAKGFIGRSRRDPARETI